MTTIEVTAKIIEKDIQDSLSIRCNLTEAFAPVQVDYGDGEWQGTQYQCADVLHNRALLARLGADLLIRECSDRHVNWEYEVSFLFNQKENEQ